MMMCAQMHKVVCLLTWISCAPNIQCDSNTYAAIVHLQCSAPLNAYPPIPRQNTIFMLPLTKEATRQICACSNHPLYVRLPLQLPGQSPSQVRRGQRKSACWTQKNYFQYLMILSLSSVCAKQILFVLSSQENIFCVQNQIIARKFARKRVRNGLEESIQFLAWARRRCCSIQRISPEEGFSVKNQTNLCLV